MIEDVIKTLNRNAVSLVSSQLFSSVCVISENYSESVLFLQVLILLHGVFQKPSSESLNS